MVVLHILTVTILYNCIQLLHFINLEVSSLKKLVFYQCLEGGEFCQLYLNKPGKKENTTVPGSTTHL